MGIDATDLFDRYEEDYEDMVGGGVPHLEINKMHISQSIEVIVGFRFFRCGVMQRQDVTSSVHVAVGSPHHKRHGYFVWFPVNSQWKWRRHH